MLRIAVLSAVLGGTLVAGPAQAQSGSIFGEAPPPRPPADVPQRSSLPPQPPPVQFPGQSTFPGPSAAPPPSNIQAQPLPPPPGGAMAPPPATLQRAKGAPPVGQPLPSQLPPAAPPPAPSGPVANAPDAAPPPPPDDTIVTEMPTQKIENARAVFSGLDKITGRIISFDAAVGETVQFGALRVTARVCYTRPPTEATNTDAFVEVDEVTLQGEIKRIFNGWMFAASPGLHAVEHPIYDVWLTDCAAPVPTKVAEPAVPPAAAPTPVRQPAAPRQPRQNPPRQQVAPAPAAQPQPN